MLPALVAVFAIGDWVAVARNHRRLEYVFKPAVMLALIAAALTLDPVSDAQRAWFVAALVLCLAGDVLLMLPQDLFVPGLAAFLAGHLAYLGGFVARGVSPPVAAVALVPVLIADAVLGRAILARVARRPELVRPVRAYILVISVMVVCALGTRVWLAGLGAVLFFASDAVLAWDRFDARPLRHGKLTVHVLYHLAQAALVGSLVVTR